MRLLSLSRLPALALLAAQSVGTTECEGWQSVGTRLRYELRHSRTHDTQLKIRRETWTQTFGS